MLWRLSFTLAAIGCYGNAALLPEKFAGFARGETAQVKPADTAIWNEFGLAAIERAEYAGPSARLAITAYRLKDPTGAFAAFQWQRPTDADSGVTSASGPR